MICVGYDVVALLLVSHTVNVNINVTSCVLICCLTIQHMDLTATNFHSDGIQA